MADPLAIIGATAAVLQSSQFTGKVIYTACSLYGSVSGHTTTDENIKKVTLTLKDLLNDLESNNNINVSTGPTSLPDIIVHCQAVGGKLLAILEKTRAKDDLSVRESLKAGIKSVWKKSEMNELRQELESCVNQLGVHLVAIFRYLKSKIFCRL